MVANFKSFSGKRNSEKKLLDNYDKHVNRVNKENKFGGKYFKRRKSYMKEFDTDDERKKIKREYHHLPKVYAKEKKIRKSKDFKEKKSEYHKKYWIDNKERLLEYHKEWLKKRRFAIPPNLKRSGILAIVI